MTKAIEHGGERLPFPVWDSQIDLPLVGRLAGTVQSAGVIVAASVVRGSVSDDHLELGTKTWSCNTAEPEFNWKWPSQYASMEFVPILQTVTEESLRAVTRWLVDLTLGPGEPVELSLDGVGAEGKLYRVRDSGYIVSYVDSETAFASACVNLDRIPGFTRVHY